MSSSAFVRLVQPVLYNRRVVYMDLLPLVAWMSIACVGMSAGSSGSGALSTANQLVSQAIAEIKQAPEAAYVHLS